MVDIVEQCYLIAIGIGLIYVWANTNTGKIYETVDEAKKDRLL